MSATLLKINPPKFKSLSFSLAIRFSVLIIAVLLIASGLHMVFDYQAQRKDIIAHQQLVAQDAANAVDGYLREKFIILDTAARRSNLFSMSLKEQKPALERLLGLEPTFRQLVLVNESAEQIVRVSRLSKVLSARLMAYDGDELHWNARQKKIYISPVYIDEITSEPMVVIAVPVTDIFGDYRGALIAESNLKFMWDLINRLKIGRNGHAYVVDKKGYLIAFRDTGRVLKRENLRHLEEVNAFSKFIGSTNAIRSRISRGILDNHVLMTHVHLNTPNWAVFVELPLMEAYESMINTLILSLLVILSVVVLSVISGFFLSKRVTQPIIELRDATKKIGQGQLDLRIDIQSDNEIGDLASSFNNMVEDLNRTTVSRNALAKEVSERKLAEASLKQSEQEMKAILMASPIGIGLISDDRFRWANDTLCRMLRREETLLLGQSVSAVFVNEKERQRVIRELYWNVTGKKRGNAETQWVRSDGTRFDCILGFCRLDPEDPSKGHIVTVNDTSEFKRLQRKLLQAQKMEAIGTLAAGVAHDLNNILSGIVSYPELILLDMDDDHPLREQLVSIKKSGEKAAAIVQDLLTMARRGVAIKEVVSINEIITDYLRSPEHGNLRSFHPGVRVKVKLDEDLLNISGSPIHLSKTIMNLVSNAAEAISSDGEIVISTYNRYLERFLNGYENIPKGEYVVLEVCDTGEGIAESETRKIFEPFYTKKKMGRSGTGLGMAVVWGTVKDHNGFIDLQSFYGQGATFRLYFPVCRKDRIKGAPSMGIDRYMAKGETVLIVDDVEEQREVASCMLKKLGYTVTSASSGEEAVEFIKRNPVDLVILDMIMDPGIGGLETYQRILAAKPEQRAIIASGFSETEQVREAQRIGAGRYLKKPYSLENIGRAVGDELASLRRMHSY
jgi:two-component system cell cycle sensor histidine kinase/response regulator CckA